MLKWTASAQKLNQVTPNGTSAAAVNMTLTTAITMSALREVKQKRLRQQRRATIANKENIPITSTPMVPRARNSPLVLAPLADILNVTPESPIAQPTTRRAQTPNSERRRRAVLASSVGVLPNRRHSTVGFALPMPLVPQYAATLPRYAEEYSPSMTTSDNAAQSGSTIMPTGQELAMRGLLPLPFMGNARYFNTPEMNKQQAQKQKQTATASVAANILPKKRKLEQEFAQIAQEVAIEQKCPASSLDNTTQSKLKQVITNNNDNNINRAANATTISTVNSTKMGDQTLDKLIDAILDSARKDEKKKKSRKSFNLRRRTLLKNQAEHIDHVTLSPSYAAGEDPAADLSFLLFENVSEISKSTTCLNQLPATPASATPLPGLAIPQAVLQQMATPEPLLLETITKPTSLTPAIDIGDSAADVTFSLETPIKPLTASRKRRKQHPPLNELSEREQTPANVRKKFKVDARNYFEIGVALPSIYV